jgi:hypothetical protein
MKQVGKEELTALAREMFDPLLAELKAEVRAAVKGLKQTQAQMQDVTAARASEAATMARRIQELSVVRQEARRWADDMAGKIVKIQAVVEANKAEAIEHREQLAAEVAALMADLDGKAKTLGKQQMDLDQSRKAVQALADASMASLQEQRDALLKEVQVDIASAQDRMAKTTARMVAVEKTLEDKAKTLHDKSEQMLYRAQASVKQIDDKLTVLQHQFEGFGLAVKALSNG